MIRHFKKVCFLSFSPFLPLSLFILPLHPLHPSLFETGSCSRTHTGLVYCALASNFSVPVSLPDMGVTGMCCHVWKKVCFPIFLEKNYFSSSCDFHNF